MLVKGRHMEPEGDTNHELKLVAAMHWRCQPVLAAGWAHHCAAICECMRMARTRPAIGNWDRAHVIHYLSFVQCAYQDSPTN